MQFNALTFHYPPTVPERSYPAGVVIATSLRVWSISQWRGSLGLARGFLRAGFAHHPTGSRVMFRLEELCPHSNAPTTGLVAHFINRFDAYYLLGQVFWCGCEFIAFSTDNIFIDVDNIFPGPNHGLPYYLSEDDEEE
ncbi:unnamed protein product [Alopecurus aequalis]